MNLKRLLVLTVPISVSLLAPACLPAQDPERLEHLERIERELLELGERRSALMRELAVFPENGQARERRELNQALSELNRAQQEMQHELDRMRREHRERDRERVRDPAGHAGDDSLHEVRQRLEHMHIAHEHLQRAGLEDLANQVRDRIRRHEEHLHRAERAHIQRTADHREHRSAAENDEFRREVLGAIRELNAAVRELRQEMHQLQRHMSGRHDGERRQSRELRDHDQRQHRDEHEQEHNGAR